MTELLLPKILALLLALTPLLIHEMGHWAVLRRWGVPVDEYWLGLGPVILRWRGLRVGMLPIGGAVVPQAQHYAKLTPLQKMWVALAGPIASTLYAALALAVWSWDPTMPGAQALWLIAMLNMVLAGLNLLPVPPLDGFQAWSQWRAHRGTPLSEQTLARALRLGNGLIYGLGFFILGLALWT